MSEVIADELLLVVKSDVSKAVAGLDKVANKAEGSMRRVGGAATKAGMALTMGLTLPIVAAGVAVFKLGMDAEDAFAKLEANAGVPRAVLDDIKGDLFDIASAMGQDLPTAADAFFMLWSGGMTDVEETLKSTEAVLMAVVANLGDSADIAQLVAVAYANLGITGAETLDVLTAAAGAAVVGPDEMGKAFMRVLGPAGLVGQSFQDMAADMVVLTNAQGNANMAATGLKGIFEQLLAPADSANKAMGKIGLTATDIKDMIGDQGLQATLLELKDTFNTMGMSDEEWIKKLFPEKSAIIAAQILMGTNMDGVVDTINGSEGALTDAWGVVDETASQQLAVAVQTVKNFGAEIGMELITMLAPYLPQFQEQLEEFTDSFEDMTDEAKMNVLKMIGGLAALGPGLLVVGFTLKTVAAGIAIFSAMLAPLAAGWSAVAAAELSAAVAGAVTIGWIVLIVAAIAAVIYIAWTFRDEIMAAFGQVMDFFKDHWGQIERTFNAGKDLVMKVVEDIVDFIVPLWQDFIAFMSEMTAELVEWWEENWPKIYKIISYVFDRVMEIIGVALTALGILWDVFWPGIEFVLKNVWEAIKLIIKVAWELISGMFSFWLSVLTGDWSGAWDAIKGIVTGVWDAIFAFVTGIFGNFIDMIQDYVDKLKERMGDGFNAVKDGITDTWDGMIEGVKSGFQGMVNWVIDKLNYLIRKVNAGSGFLNKIPGVSIPKISELGSLGFGGQDLAGTFKVGDRGLPEIVSLPGGSSVTPLAPGESGDKGMTINLNAPQNDPEGIARELGWELTKRGL
jgi:TP901 family phage tail tape measure protein